MAMETANTDKFEDKFNKEKSLFARTNSLSGK